MDAQRGRGKSPRSIQGEQQDAAGTLYASPDQVTAYLRQVSEGVATCRQRGRHLYPPTRRRSRITFHGYNTRTKCLIHRKQCTSCGLVERVEEWRVSAGDDDIVTECELIDAYPDYSLRGPDGEKYLADEGTGRMTPKMVQNVIMSECMVGAGLADLIRQAREIQALADA